MPNVFNINQVHGGSFKADMMQVSFGTMNATGMLLQNIQFTYTQQVTILYEIGGTRGVAKVYYVGGRAQGTATVARVIGPAQGQLRLITEYGDICTPKDIDFNAQSACQAGGGVRYKLMKAVLTSVGCSVAAQDIVVHEQLQFMFLNLQAT